MRGARASPQAAVVSHGLAEAARRALRPDLDEGNPDDLLLLPLACRARGLGSVRPRRYGAGTPGRAWRVPPTDSPRSRSTMSARSVLHPRLCRLCASAPEAGTSFVASRPGDGIAAAMCSIPNARSSGWVQLMT